MILDVNTQIDTQIDSLFVREAELFCELMDAGLLCQVLGLRAFDVTVGCGTRPLCLTHD